MLKYHVILNACCQDFAKQARELNGFIQKNCADTMQQGNTVIICDREQNGDDKKRLADLAPTKSVIFIIQDYYDPEGVLSELVSLVQKDSLYLFGSNFSGSELSVRFGQRTGGSSIQSAMALGLDNDRLLAEKMTYSNHMKGTWHLQKTPYCIAISKGQDEAEPLVSAHEVVQEVVIGLEHSAGVRKAFQPYEESNSLAAAPFVLVTGRGIKRKEMAEIPSLAARMGAAFGASRPVVMNAWAPMEKMVGVSGAMLKPEICIAAGVSGAPALYAGIEKSRFIVAVNSDDRAPIIKKADVAIVGDGKEIVEALAYLIEQGGYIDGKAIDSSN